MRLSRLSKFKGALGGSSNSVRQYSVAQKAPVAISYCQRPTLDDAAANEIRCSRSLVVVSACRLSSMAAPRRRMGVTGRSKRAAWRKRLSSGSRYQTRSAIERAPDQNEADDHDRAARASRAEARSGPHNNRQRQIQKSREVAGRNPRHILERNDAGDDEKNADQEGFQFADSRREAGRFGLQGRSSRSGRA